jgi:hypothetical protein
MEKLRKQNGREDRKRSWLVGSAQSQKVNERATQLLRFEEQFLSLHYRCQKISGDAIFEEIQIYYLVSTSRFVGI